MNYFQTKVARFGFGILLGLVIILGGCTYAAAPETQGVAPDIEANQAVTAPRLWSVEADGTEMERAMIDQPRTNIKIVESGLNPAAPRLWPIEDDGMEMERAIYDQPRSDIHVK